jgi:hypothetical protein
MPPTPPHRPPVARFLATSSAWIRNDDADVHRVDNGSRVGERSRPAHSEPMGERELIAHRRRLRALWIAQWEASLQEKLGVAPKPLARAPQPAEVTAHAAADNQRQLATHTE